jgi:Tol biopolymer transport system component
MLIPGSTQATVPGGNGKIAYVAGGGGIYTVNPDGSNATPVGSASGWPSGWPAWSPDGSKLAFTDHGHIFVVNADGGNLVQLTTALYDYDTTWSPDGTKIAFARYNYDAGVQGIFVMGVDGSNQHPVTNGPDFYPAWSPDGTKIAFTRVRGGSTEDIYVMNANGTNVTRLYEKTTSLPSGDHEPAPVSPVLRLPMAAHPNL